MIAVGAVQAVVDRTADLLNALAAPNVAPDEVDAVLRAHGEVDPVTTAEDVAELRAAADELRSVLAADSLDQAAERVNALLSRTAHPPRLSNHGGTFSWHLHVDSDDEEAPLAEWFLASASMLLALLVSDRQRLPGGVCAARGCELVFIDTAHGSRRRYCSRRCATRERVAAHRARR
ncbi:CGNR zinc finger domain-containing protein [Nocardiopsis metallicus]